MEDKFILDLEFRKKVIKGVRKEIEKLWGKSFVVEGYKIDLRGDFLIIHTDQLQDKPGYHLDIKLEPVVMNPSKPPKCCPECDNHKFPN